MKTQSPRVLLQLAIESLLKDKVLAMAAIDYLPGELFPRVFREAFASGQTEILKAMVLSWPFPSLPLGALMGIRQAGTLDTQEDGVQAEKRVLRAVLDGLHVLLSQKLCSRRVKLQALDMRATQETFWRVWAGNQLEDSSLQFMKWRKIVKTWPAVPKKKIFRIFSDFWIKDECLCPLPSALLQWFQEREDLVQLDCLKLRITAKSFQHVREVLEVLDLDSVQEVDVGHHWTIFTLAEFAPFLGQMKNLHKLTLRDISVPASMFPEEVEQLIAKITFQFTKLHGLWEVCMDSVEFLEDHLGQVLRCLTSPLETLSITHCRLSPSAWKLLPCSEQINQLQDLDLSCTRLTSFRPEILQHLLRSVSATLTSLCLENCGLTDAQICAFLPFLSSCSQLTAFFFVKNFMSVDTMKNLLCHTAKLSKLILEVYSVPQEVHDIRNGINLEIWMEVFEALRRIIQPLKHPRNVWFCIFNNEFCCKREFYKMHPNPCPGCIAV